MKNVRWQGCNAHTLQLIVGKALVPVKPLIVRVKRLIEFFMRPKQSERLEDIQKKYPDLNLENDENLDETEKENIVITLFFSTLFNTLKTLFVILLYII